MVIFGVLTTLFLLATASSALFSNEEPLATERDLRRDLFQNYDKLVRPVKRPSDSVPFSINFTPIQLKALDEYNQVLSLEGWMVMNWTDEYLQWDANIYNNITTLRLPSSEVWKPDLSLYTATDDGAFFPTTPTQVVVFNNGVVLWVPPFTIKSRCPMLNNKRTAKTIVECSTKFGSWTYSENELNLQLAAKKVDISNFADIHPKWKLVHILSDRQSKRYPCCVENYPSVNFNITLRRRGPTFDDNLLQKEIF